MSLAAIMRQCTERVTSGRSRGYPWYKWRLPVLEVVFTSGRSGGYQ